MKQRLLVHRAIDRNGKVVRHGIEIGGKVLTFTGSDAYRAALRWSSGKLLGGLYGVSRSRWFSGSRRRGAVKFVKFIIWT